MSDLWTACRVPDCGDQPPNEWRPFCLRHWSKLSKHLRTYVSDLVRDRQQGTQEFEDMIAECIESLTPASVSKAGASE